MTMNTINQAKTRNARDHRAAIAQDTLSVIEHGGYLNREGQRIDIGEALARSVAGSVHYTGAELRTLREAPVPPGSSQTHISVSNETSLCAVRRLAAEGHDNALCLNFASARNPGGGFLGGAEAQEENLAKSSGLYACLITKMEMYSSNRAYAFCAYHDDMIYSPGVPVFRDDDYEYLDRPVLASFVTAPAVNRSAVKQNTPHRLHELEEIMPRRIEFLLALAHYHGHDCLVLGAWGCGVFGNDPAQMAGWFADALEGPFRDVFARVHFAVLDRRDDGTHAAFAKRFGT